jgi:glycogen debranching enzyme
MEMDSLGTLTSDTAGWKGALYPPHEEIICQAYGSRALLNIADLADQIKDRNLAAARALPLSALERRLRQPLAGRSRVLMLLRLIDRGCASRSEFGPNRDRRQTRLNEISKVSLIDEDTVLPAVPLWWRTLDDERAQSEIDHLGSGAIATDWGARIISNRSKLYDPLSYHYGSVWPLFTGWVSMGAYRYGRPHVGYQALMANALLTYSGALGYVTELLWRFQRGVRGLHIIKSGPK